MATDEQKKARELRLYNDILAGFAKGLYDLFEDAALAIMKEIGAKVLAQMEDELALEIQGESPQDILDEIARLLVDEYGLMTEINITFDDESHHLGIHCQDCSFWQLCSSLKSDNIEPYVCVPMMMSTSSLHQRLGQRAKFGGITLTESNRTCAIDFQMID